jgi:hypothetical protein
MSVRKLTANGLRAGFRGRFRNVINVQMSSEILKCKIPAMKLARCYAIAKPCFGDVPTSPVCKRKINLIEVKP